MLKIRKFIENNKGATAIEYGLIAALIAVAMISTLTQVGSGTIPGGPKGSTSHGTDAGGRATGLTDPSGSRPLGGDGTGGSDAGGGPTGGSGGPS